MEKLTLRIKQQRYGSRIVLQDLDQAYEKGKIHGFLGENGAGKTTLFRCMTNQLPYQGERMIADQLAFGYLPAELYMYSMITGEEFLRFYVTAKGCKYEETEKARLNDFFELPLKDYAEVYSTGMLKKLYLLGILLQHSELLLLDEPFNGLDFVSSAFITALLQRLREEGKTIFVASHDLGHLFSFADTLSVLKEGRLTCYERQNDFQTLKESIEQAARRKVQAALGMLPDEEA